MNWFKKQTAHKKLVDDLNVQLLDAPAHYANMIFELRRFMSYCTFYRSMRAILLPFSVLWAFCCLPATVRDNISSLRSPEQDKWYEQLSLFLTVVKLSSKDKVRTAFAKLFTLTGVTHQLLFHLVKGQSYQYEKLIEKLLIYLETTGEPKSASSMIKRAREIYPRDLTINSLDQYIQEINSVQRQIQDFVKNETFNSLRTNSLHEKLLISLVIDSVQDAKILISHWLPSILPQTNDRVSCPWQLSFLLITNGETRKFLEYKDLETNFSIENLFIVEANFSNDESCKTSLNQSFFESREKIGIFLAQKMGACIHFSCVRNLYNKDFFIKLRDENKAGNEIIFTTFDCPKHPIFDEPCFHSSDHALQMTPIFLSHSRLNFKKLISPGSLRDGIFCLLDMLGSDKSVSCQPWRKYFQKQPKSNRQFRSFTKNKASSVEGSIGAILPNRIFADPFTDKWIRHKKALMPHAFTKSYKDIAFLREDFLSEMCQLMRLDSICDASHLNDIFETILAFNRKSVLSRHYLSFYKNLEKIFWDNLDKKLVFSSKEQLRHTLVNLLRLGYLQSARKLILLLDDEQRVFFPFKTLSFVASTMDTISSATAFSGIRCGSWISSILWGKTHAEVFCDVHLASLLAEGNLPNLSKKSTTGHLIICDKTAKNIIQNSDIFFRLKKIVHVEFLTLPSSVCKELRDPNLKDLFYVIYGLIDHLGIHFAKKQSANLFLLPVDSVLSENCLVRFYQAFGKGYEVCGGGNIVACQDEFIKYVSDKKIDGVFSASPSELALVAEEFQHQYFASQLLSTSNLHFGKHARELFIPKGNKIAIRSVFVHPVAIRSDVLERYDTAHFANVDYGMIPNIVFDEKRIFLTGVQSDCYLTNFCENERVFETEPSPFKQSIFIRAHEYSYRVQRKLFSFEQLVPCAKEYEEIPEVDEKLRDLCCHLDKASSKTSTKANGPW